MSEAQNWDHNIFPDLPTVNLQQLALLNKVRDGLGYSNSVYWHLTRLNNDKALRWRQELRQLKGPEIRLKLLYLFWKGVYQLCFHECVKFGTATFFFTSSLLWTAAVVGSYIFMCSVGVTLEGGLRETDGIVLVGYFHNLQCYQDLLSEWMAFWCSKQSGHDKTLIER